MRKFLHFLIFSGFLFLIFPHYSVSQRVDSNSDIYYGTKSDRSTGNFYRHTRNDTDWDTTPYNDFYFQRSWESTPTNFRFLYPEGLDTVNGTQKYPMIVMLHGLGEGGGRGLLKGGYSNYVPGSPEYNQNFYLNNNHQLKNGGKVHLGAVKGTDSQNREFPGFVMFPQTLTSTYNNQTPGWVESSLIKVTLLIDQIVKIYPIDVNRIYVHGLSNGGNATWKIVDLRPDLFAAYLPMAGHPLFNLDIQKTAHIPLWLFQGKDDPTSTASPQTSRNTIAALEAAGATPRYTEFDSTGHNAWDKAYAEHDFFSWMLGQSKTNIHIVDGKSEFCLGDNISAELELDPNFSSYQWMKNEEIIPGANTFSFTATEYATYRGSFLRPGSNVREWSDPVEISIKELTEPVKISASGSTTLPSLDGSNSVTLSVPAGYQSYNWQNSNSTINEVLVSSAGEYRVSVTEEGGCPSSFSPYVVVTVGGPTDAVTVPSNFAGEVVSNSRINLFWQDNSSNETGFEIYRSTQEGGPYEFITKTKKNVVFFADKDLTTSTTYYYILRAVNDEGSSEPTGEIAIITAGDLSKPSVPQNLTASANLDLTSISLAWNSASDDIGVTSYSVYSVNSDNSLSFIESTTDTTFNHTGLEAETNYTYVVTASDASGKTSDRSNQASAITIHCGLQYKLYANFIYNSVNDIGLIATELKGSGKMDNFDLYPGVDYYNSSGQDVSYFGIVYEGYIYLEAGDYEFYTRSDDGSTLSIDGELIVNNDLRQSPTTVRKEFTAPTTKAYKISVKYFNSGGGYEFSVGYKPLGSIDQPIPNEILCNTLGVPSPIVPNPVSNLIANAVSENRIDLEWSHDGDNLTGFELYRSKLPTGPFNLIYTAPENTFEYSDLSLEASTIYYYRVRAIGANGSSVFNDETGDGSVFYSYYEAYTTSVKDFNFNATPKSTGYTDNFNINLAEKSSNYVFKFEGEILISNPGIYTFFTNSDDGSMLFIENNQVVNNNGNHGMEKQKGEYKFDSPGAYPITVKFNQGGGGAGLEVSFSGPGIKERLIADADLNSDIVNATTSGDVVPPTAPTGLTVKSVSNTAVGLFWTPSTDNVAVIGYQIFNVRNVGDTVYVAQTNTLGDVVDNVNVTQNGDDNTDSNTSPDSDFNSSRTNGEMSLLQENSTASVSRISTSIEGLTNGSDYYFVVKALDAAGNLSKPSNVVDFTTGEEAPLPIELVDFFAIPKDGYVELNWITASETNNDYFVLLRSLDGKEFREIGTLEGAGDSNTMLYYIFNDELPVNGIMYYQLKQVDTNGIFAMSRIIRVDYNKAAAAFDLKVFPNPVKDNNFEIEMTSSNEESDVYIRITDMVGRVYLDKVYSANELLNKLMMSKVGLSGGIYIISLQQAGNKIQKKIIVE